MGFSANTHTSYSILLHFNNWKSVVIYNYKPNYWIQHAGWAENYGSFEYDIKNFVIKHYDLYRLKNVQDINNLGIFEHIEQSITLIEWPELIQKKPSNRIDLFFEYIDNMNKRSLSIKTTGRLTSHEF